MGESVSDSIFLHDGCCNQQLIEIWGETGG